MVQPSTGEIMGESNEGMGRSGGSSPDVILNKIDQNLSELERPANVFELNSKKIYSIEEVDRFLPIVKRITQEYVEKVQVLMARFEAAKGRHDQKLPIIEREINEAVQGWQGKMEKLGLKTKGLWIADFDSGDGYFCWKYPEEKVNFWHQYQDGFGGRIKIDREQIALGKPISSQQTPPSPNL